MAIVTSYPGVYIQEDDSPVVSIHHGATAVPVFILEDNDPLALAKMCMVTSWFDYVTTVRQVTNQDIDLDNNLRDINTKAYFECGGGRCYFISNDHGDELIPQYDDITLVVNGLGPDFKPDVFDINPLCQPGTGRFGLLSGPSSKLTSDYDPAGDYSSNPCVAVYYPWLTASWTSQKISPAVVMAGIYCANDRQYGVWKAPANIALPTGYQPCYLISDGLQGQFNSGLAINMIRTFPHRGTVVWGARTLEDSDNWRYIPVRRLFDSAERDIKAMMNTLMFEPNTQPTWVKAGTAINNYLYGLWCQGALQGNTEQDAYYVQIGIGTTMTDDDINQGKMIVKVAMAPVKPAEFIILQFTQQVDTQ